MENPNLVQHSNQLQHAVKTQRKITMEQNGKKAAAGQEQAVKKIGTLSVNPDQMPTPSNQINQMERFYDTFAVTLAQKNMIRKETSQNREEMKRKNLQTIAELVKQKKPPTPDLNMGNVDDIVFKGV